MKFAKIRNFSEINTTDAKKVEEIKKSMKENGFVGCPILIEGEYLITGSHRLQALKELADEYDNEESDLDVESWEVAEDVSDILQEYVEKNDLEYIENFEYDSIGQYFEGTWVEEYKNEIPEW